MVHIGKYIYGQSMHGIDSPEIKWLARDILRVCILSGAFLTLPRSASHILEAEWVLWRQEERISPFQDFIV